MANVKIPKRHEVIKEGLPNSFGLDTHEHEWVYQDVMRLTYPSRINRICKVCGRVEVEIGEVYYEMGEYDRVYQTFHGETFHGGKP